MKNSSYGVYGKTVQTFQLGIHVM